MARLLRLPVHKQERLLFEQKYPKDVPQRFRTPYYQPALSGIRGFFKSGSTLGGLDAARSRIDGIAQETRRANNNRVLDKFQQSSLATRNLRLQPNSRYGTQIGDIRLKVSADLQAVERERRKIFYFHCCGKQLDEDLARSTIEIAHWVLKSEEVPIDAEQIEFIDFFSGKAYRVEEKELRAVTIVRLTDTLKTIVELWPSL